MASHHNWWFRVSKTSSTEMCTKDAAKRVQRTHVRVIRSTRMKHGSWRLWWIFFSVDVVFLVFRFNSAGQNSISVVWANKKGKEIDRNFLTLQRARLNAESKVTGHFKFFTDDSALVKSVLAKCQDALSSYWWIHKTSFFISTWKMFSRHRAVLLILVRKKS